MKKILVIDNHDSFVYNLIEYLRRLGDCEIEVIHNEQICQVDALHYDGILLSPGAGLPSDYPQMQSLLSDCYQTIPILGICLGHQAIAVFFGAHLKRLAKPKHGHNSQLQITDKDDILWQHITPSSAIGRYHSWVIDALSIPEQLKVTALDEEGNVMGIKHAQYPIWGVQFHPESIITEQGMLMLENWLSTIKEDKKK